MSRIQSLLITGSNGFVGKSFLDYLVTRPIEGKPISIGLVFHKTAPQIPIGLNDQITITHIRADLNRPWEFEYPATHVMHLAADGSASAYSTEAAHRFVSMVDHLVSWCAKLPTPLVFHASSGACFGHVSIDMTADGGVDPAKKKSEFVQSRLTAENNLKTAASKGLIDLRIGRLFSFIGKHLHEKPHYAVPAFVEMAMSAKKIELSGNPLTTRSYLSSNDMSDWMYRSLQPNIGSDVLSIGSDKPVTMKELADYIASVTNSSVSLLNPAIAGDYYVASNQDTRARLLVRETASWQTSIDEYLAFFQEMRTDERR